MPIEFYRPSYSEAVRGDWWRAGHEDQKVRCKLTIQRDGRCEVTLDEGGTELFSLYADEHAPFHAEVLHLRPTPVTAFGQVTIGETGVGIGTEDMRGWHHGHVQVDELLYGIHINDRSAHLVNRVTFHTDRIHEIFQLEGLQVSRRPGSKVKLRFRPPQIDLLQLDDNTIVKLNCQLSQGWPIGPPENVTFKQYTRIEIHYRSLIPLDECKKHITKVQTFLSFCLQALTIPRDIFMLCRDARRVVPKKDRARRWISFLQPYSVSDSEGHRVPNFRNDVRLIDKYVAGSQTTILHMLREWWLHYDDLEPVIGLYLSSLPTRMNHKFVEFLLLTQALEAYHRRMIGGEYESRSTFHSATYEQLRRAIPRNITPAYRRRIESGLTYLNEYSLRKRLRSLVKLSMNDVGFAFEESEVVVGEIVDLRNKFTHYDGSVSETDFVDIDLWRATAGAKILLDSCLLHQLGVPEQAAKNAIDINCSRNGAHLLLRSG